MFLKYFKKAKSSKSGFALLEILISLIIFALLAVSIVGVMLSSFRSLEQADKYNEAVALAQESIEAARSIMERGWNELFLNQTGIEVVDGLWQFKGEGTSDVLGNFTRIMSFQEVCRDAVHNIVGCPGLYTDIYSKKVISEVTWTNTVGGTNNVRQTAYLTNWESQSWFEDLKTDFIDGTFNNTEVSDTAGDGDGAVTLQGVVSEVTWECIKEEGFVDISGIDDSLANAVSGNTLLVSQGQILFSFDISDPLNPVQVGSFNAGGTIYSIYTEGYYAFLSTGNDLKEMIIVNFSDPSNLAQTGSYDADSDSDGLDVYVYGDRAYLVTAKNTTPGISPEFYIINISNLTTPVLAHVDSHYDTTDDAYGVSVSGNYAYLATGNSSTEFIVLDIADESAITLASALNMNYALADIKIKENYAYVVTKSSGGELTSINISNPSNPVITDTITYAGITFNRIDIFGSYAFLSTEDGLKEAILTDITDPADLTDYNYIDHTAPVNDIAVSDTVIYLASDADDKEVGIFETKNAGSWECIELVKEVDIPDASDAYKVFVQTQGGNQIAYIVRDDGSFMRLYSYNVTNPSAPIELDNFSVNGDINDLYVTNQYVYLATSLNNKELLILDASNPADLIEVGSYNADSTSDGLDVFASGNRVYLTTKKNTSSGINPEFYIINVTNPASPVLAHANSHYSNDDDINTVFVSGGYAYLGCSKSNQEFTVVNITNEASLSEAGIYNHAHKIIDLHISGSYAYAIADDDFFILNVSNVANIYLEGIFDMAGTATGLDVNGSYAYVSTFEDTKELQIFDIIDKTKPTLKISYDNLNNDAYDVFKLGNYVYFATAKDNAELVIVTAKGTSYDPENYPQEGEYISSAFDTGAGTRAIQAVKWSEYIPSCSPPCDILVQVKSAQTQILLATAEWCGPDGKDGDDTDFYTNPFGELINIDHNGDRWVQYKAILKGDGKNSPILSDITINYK